MNEQEDNVTLTRQEFQEIVNELERLSLEEAKDQSYDWMLFTGMFWDNFLTKIISNFISVKMWILIFVLFVPYELLKKGFITGDHYTNILIVVAPIVIGLREFAKMKVDSASPNKILDKIKGMFKV